MCIHLLAISMYTHITIYSNLIKSHKLILQHIVKCERNRNAIFACYKKMIVIISMTDNKTNTHPHTPSPTVSMDKITNCA